jgi:hypothetical protein
MINVSNIVVAASLLFLFQSATVPPAYSGDGHVVLTNNTREQIIEIYVSDDHTDNWQEAYPVVPGSSILCIVASRPATCGGREGAPSGKGTISERIPGEFSRRDELRGISV